MLGESCRITTFGLRADLLLADGVEEGAWQQRHVGSTPGAENLAAVLGAADIFVDVAPGELTGRMLLSAMACGAVPVAADTGVALEITAGGRDGLLVDAGPRTRGPRRSPHSRRTGRGCASCAGGRWPAPPTVGSPPPERAAWPPSSACSEDGGRGRSPVRRHAARDTTADTMVKL